MMKKLNKKKLTIQILDDEEEEKMLQENHLNKIKDIAGNLINNFNIDELQKMQIDENINSYSPDINLLIRYMEGKNEELDVSYIWLTNLASILKLSKCIYFSPKSWEAFKEVRDFQEEFNVRKFF